MTDLFAPLEPDPSSKREAANRNAPLAERIRPATIDEVIGQRHLLGPGAPLRRFFENGDFPSIIFWGPPGVGKTTLAQLMAGGASFDFQRLSAIEAGVKDVRAVISAAQNRLRMGRRTLLFIDEIHRFNKSQQDALLHAVEKGVITLVGATTENPSFEVNAALLSRCQVYRLKELNRDEVRAVVERAIASDEKLRELNIQIDDWDALLRLAAGDARNALNALDMAATLAGRRDEEVCRIDADILERALQHRTARYDKKGDNHYDAVSAFIKSMRGSDPDAALLWLAHMLEAGEDPKFIARRMVIFASEDIGNADPMALVTAVNVFQAVNLIGMPECQLNLAQGVTYLASAAKSNASYTAVKQARALVSQQDVIRVPHHLRNAPTELMKNEGFGQGYQYPHDHPSGYLPQQYFPEGMAETTLYRPVPRGVEAEFAERLQRFRPERYPEKNGDEDSDE